jgi:S1-C subfamily serine protease
MLEGMTAGQKILFDLYREGAVHEATAVAEEMPPSIVRRIANQKLGLDLEFSEQGSVFEIVDVSPGSAAEGMGLRPGDFVLGINGIALTSNDNLRRAVARLRGRPRALVVVQRGPGRYHLTIPLF